MSAFPSAAGLYLRFRSRIDAWLGGVILLRILIGAALAIGLLLQKGIASLAIAPLLAAGLSLWMLVETWYGTDLVLSVVATLRQVLEETLLVWNRSTCEGRGGS